MPKLTFPLLTLTLWIVGVSPAHGAIQYAYVPDLNNPPQAGDNLTGAPTYIVAPGGSVTVNLFILENTTGASGSLINQDGGLFGAGLFVTKTGVSGTASITNSALNSSQFTSGTNTNTFTATQAHLVEAVASGLPNQGIPATSFDAPNNLNYVFLGSVTITVGNTPGDTTTYQVSTDGSGNTITQNVSFDLDQTNNGNAPAPPGGFDYDAANPASFNVEVQPAEVPEPTSLFLLCTFRENLSVRLPF